jgi:hypothetical protein
MENTVGPIFQAFDSSEAEKGIKWLFSSGTIPKTVIQQKFSMELKMFTVFFI